MVSKPVRLIRTGTRETHLGQESTLHPKAGYIDADCSRPSAFLLQSRGGPYIVGSNRLEGHRVMSVADCSQQLFKTETVKSLNSLVPAPQRPAQKQLPRDLSALRANTHWTRVLLWELFGVKI